MIIITTEILIEVVTIKILILKNTNNKDNYNNRMRTGVDLSDPLSLRW